MTAGLTDAEKRELLRLLELRDEMQAGRRLQDYRPYPKQEEFHAAGAKWRERLLMAGNQLGKTLAAAAETAMHLTGMYPDWWRGKRFTKPVQGVAASETGLLTRDGVQRLLFGTPAGKLGTGMVPRASIVGNPVLNRHGVADAYEMVRVRHEPTGGESVIYLRSYDQGRARVQAMTLDFAWLDEEPDYDFYTEIVTRTNVAFGPVYLTFTPLKGMSGVVQRFLKDKFPGTHVTSMTIYDVEHYSPEQRDAIIASYPEHEREARAKGVPAMGSGRVFPLREETLMVPAFAIPAHWARIGGIDFGVDHPTAAAWLAIDRDTDTVYVTDAYRASDGGAAVHASALRSRGHKWMPWAWPHDGLQRSKDTGRPLRDVYEAEGLKMLGEHATNEDGGVSVESSLQAMLYDMQGGRFKVFSHLADWFEEFRLYHRKDGKVVKLMDDLMSATRYAWMMRRAAIVQPRERAGRAAASVGDSYSGY